MKIGYARVSSTGQDYQTQLDKLQAAGCEKIFHEKQSGKSAGDRAQLQAALEFARDGDVFVITKLDRLARSMNDMTTIASQLQKRGVGFVVTDQQIDTTTPTGKLLFNILGSLAEFERDLINARCDEGRKAAKAAGVQFGRKPTIDRVKLLELKQAGMGGTEIAKTMGIGRATVYKILKELR